MGRHEPPASYDHRIRKMGHWGMYEISWMIDHYYKDSRLRYPRRTRRHTDKAGARRFAKKWELKMPDEDNSS